MSKYFTFFISPLILLLGFWLFFYYKSGIFWLIAISLLTIIITSKILSRQYFWKFKLLWVNLLVVYISELLFLLLLTSKAGRYWTSFLLVLAWAVLWILLQKHFQTIKSIGSRDYLALSRFFYYLGFWFLSSSLYSLIIFLNLSLWYSLLAILIVTFLWMKDMTRAMDDVSKYYIVFAIFLLAQVLAILYFLPISFYIAGTIATLWFFFIMDNIVSKLHYFKLYLGLFFLSVAILLITSII